MTQGPAEPQIPREPVSRETNLARLRERPLDVLIMGGGINGAGIARDLALRSRTRRIPLRIGLVEQRHFASGTSGRNSQLIHGGLRYLKGLEFGLVSEALRERTTVLGLAPHLAHPQPFLIPMYGRFDRFFYGLGLWIYDLLAGSQTLGRRRTLDRGAVSRLEPGLAADDLAGGAIFFDARIHSARFVLENVFEAASDGAIVANYARAERTKAGAVTIHDTLSGEPFEVRAKKIVDATGPWADPGGLRLVRGSHIVVPRVNHSDNAIAYFEPGGRIIFVIPWGERRNLSLVGTTDIDHSSGPDDVSISPEEVRYLLAILRRLYPGAAAAEPLAAYSSLRPLLRDDSASATRASRGHRIWNTPDGVLHVAGGKYTTYRAMSQEAADLVAREIAPELAKTHETGSRPLGGNSRQRIDSLRAEAPGLAALHGVGEEDVERMIGLYGVKTPVLLASLPAAGAPALSRLDRARIAFAVRHEMARRLPDLMFVSTYWGYEAQWTEETLAPYAAAMGGHLGWSSSRTRQETGLVAQLTASPAVP
ncbi:MAG TPA: glycerol-3-phosphate dehydrogenase/oxidase [Bryobacteraceae bacterium]|nr:glycerol-3-phosphate dehydrogenase/oxidase [Bryobacteraceae bacterium]